MQDMEDTKYVRGIHLRTTVHRCAFKPAWLLYSNTLLLPFDRWFLFLYLSLFAVPFLHFLWGGIAPSVYWTLDQTMASLICDIILDHIVESIDKLFLIFNSSVAKNFCSQSVI